MPPAPKPASFTKKAPANARIGQVLACTDAEIRQIEQQMQVRPVSHTTPLPKVGADAADSRSQGPSWRRRGADRRPRAASLEPVLEITPNEQATIACSSGNEKRPRVS